MGAFARTPTTATMNTLLALAVLGAVRTHAITPPGVHGYSGVVVGVGMLGIFFTNIKALFCVVHNFVCKVLDVRGVFWWSSLCSIINYISSS